MDNPLHLLLREGVSFTQRSEGGIIVARGDDAVVFDPVTSGLMDALRRLEPPGAGTTEVADVVRRTDGPEGVQRWSQIVANLARHGLVNYAACQDGQRLAVLAPTSNFFELNTRAITPDRLYVLSRFAYSRREGDKMILESPLSHSRIILDRSPAALLVHALARPCRLNDLPQEIPELSTDGAAGLTALLHGSGMLTEWNDGGSSAEDETPAS